MIVKNTVRIALIILTMAVSIYADNTVLERATVTATPRWPWNGLVDITFSLPKSGNSIFYMQLKGYDHDKETPISLHTLFFNGKTRMPLPNAKISAIGGNYNLIWDAGKDYPMLNTSSFSISLVSTQSIETPFAFLNEDVPVKVELYMVVDLVSGGVRYQADPPDLSNDTCRTTELWLRWVPNGTFTMGAPLSELGRDDNEVQHQVTLTSWYFIGVFEVTQKQWELIMGGNPSYCKGDTRPVEKVEYNDIRGSVQGAGWPTGGHAVDEDSFLGKLRVKTGLAFDLPTEAQWEYACRAGTTTALNSGKNLTSYAECPNMAEVGRFRYNRNDGKGGYGEHTKVGSYLPNAWGLYDMHGNVEEWCLDYYDDYPMSNVSGALALTDPQGPELPKMNLKKGVEINRVARGGFWNCNARDCRSATRIYSRPSSRYDFFGFRVVLAP